MACNGTPGVIIGGVATVVEAVLDVATLGACAIDVCMRSLSFPVPGVAICMALAICMAMAILATAVCRHDGQALREAHGRPISPKVFYRVQTGTLLGALACVRQHEQ